MPNPRQETEQHRLFSRGKVEVRFSSAKRKKPTAHFFLYHECFGKGFILMLAGCARRGLSGGPQIGATRWTQFWVRFLFPGISMFNFFDRSVRGGPILGSAWRTPKWVRYYKICQQAGPPSGPSFGSVFYFSEIPIKTDPKLGPPGGPNLGSAWRTPKWVRRSEPHHVGPGGFGGAKHIVLICIFKAY